MGQPSDVPLGVTLPGRRDPCQQVGRTETISSPMKLMTESQHRRPASRVAAGRRRGDGRLRRRFHELGSITGLRSSLGREAAP